MSERGKKRLSVVKGRRVPLGQELLHSRIEEVARLHPSRPALIHHDVVITFGQLTELSERISTRLGQFAYPTKVNNDVRYPVVGMYMKQGIDRIITQLGVLRAGLAYMPLDPNMPLKRTLHYCKTCQPLVLILDEQFSTSDLVTRIRCPTISYQEFSHELKLSTTDSKGSQADPYTEEFDENETAEDVLISYTNDVRRRSMDSNLIEDYQSSHRLCCVLFTSGTTGTPKGVPLTHRNVYNTLHWHMTEYPWGEDDVGITHTNYMSVAGIEEIFVPLLSGNPQVVLSEMEAKDPKTFLTIATGRNVSRISFISPTLLRNILEYMKMTDWPWPSLKYVDTGGENLAKQLIKDFLSLFTQEVVLVNGWGMTELGPQSIVQVFDKSTDLSKVIVQGKVSIGFPLYNTCGYVVDDNKEIVEEGVVGKLAVSSISLTQRYINCAQGDVITPNPYQEQYIYPFLIHTSDLCQVVDGMLIFEGRETNMVKIRGHRVNTDEIENTIQDCVPLLKQVSIVETIDTQKMPQIICFFSTKKGSDVSSKDVLTICKDALPEFMVPARAFKLDNLPIRSPTNKVDKHALRELYDKELQQSAKSSADLSNTLLVNDNEGTLLCKSLQAVLHVEANDISMDTSFYTLGGTSTAAVELWKLLANEGYDINVCDILASKSIRDIYKVLLEGTTGNVPEPDDVYVVEFLHSQTEGMSALSLVAQSFQKDNPVASCANIPSCVLQSSLRALLWKASSKVGFSKVVRSQSQGRIVAVSVCIPAQVVLELDYDSIIKEYPETKDFFRFLQYYENYCLNNLKWPAHKILWQYCISADKNMPPEFRLQFMRKLDHANIKEARHCGYSRLATINLHPVAVEIAVHNGFSIDHQFRINQFQLEDTFPFASLADNVLASCQSIDLSTQPVLRLA